MKLIILLSLFFFSSFFYFPNKNYRINTSDINNFWEAFDALENAKSYEDSVDVFQKLYMDRASNDFKKFIKVRNFTAKEYVQKIRKHPLFWNSIRPLTLKIEHRKNELEEVFVKLEKAIPNYQQPDVCFAIGCMRTGGTTSKNLVLVGAEIVAADSTIERSELSFWLKNVLGNTGDIVGMVAHETIHTQQFDKRKIRRGKNALIEQTLTEGVADLLTHEILGININQHLQEFGEKNQCELWKEFESDRAANPKDFSKWLYNGGKELERPADLGYYLGFKVAQYYYSKQKNKRSAIKNLLNQKKYRKIYKQNKYWEKNCKN